MKTLLLALCCCTLAHAADSVTIVKDPAATAACTVLAQVKSSPPYWTFHTARNQLIAQTAALHGDTLLITSTTGWFTQGVAYRCAK